MGVPVDLPLLLRSRSEAHELVLGWVIACVIDPSFVPLLMKPAADFNG